MKLLSLPFFIIILVFLVGCDDHGHDHEGTDAHQHGAESHHRDSIDVGTERGEEHGHDHGGHDEAGIVITHFSHATELFVEFPAFVVGEESAFAAHLTYLDSYKPVVNGKVTVTLSGGGKTDEVFTAEGPGTPGIFKPVAIPQHAVKRKLSLRLQTENLDVIHELGEYMVYSSLQDALANMPQSHEPDDAISYLKEQQWQVDFAVSQAITQQLRASLQATGTIRPRAGGEVYLSATTAGHIQSKDQFPFPGMEVVQGQVLASISPRLGAGGDLATLKAARDKARSEYQLAKHEKERLEMLWQEKAIAQHRLHEAESAEAVAKAEFNAAVRRYKQSTGGKQSSHAGIPILAPISGLLAQVNLSLIHI